MQLDNQLIVHRRDIDDINRELLTLRFTTQLELTKILDELEKNVRSIIVEEDGEEPNKEKDEEAKEGQFD